VNTHRVPERLRDPFMAGVDALHEQVPVCLPPVQASSPPPPSAPAETAPAPTPRPSKEGHGHGHGHGHGKGGKH
jgi:hypothetical protein